jgi:TRAP-type C4-dicarboxylate transport system substrate-binding protein
LTRLPWSRWLLALVVALALPLEITLRLGYVTPPAHPYGQAVDFFVNEVRKASNGRINIQTRPVYAGGNDIQLLNDVKGGVVDMGSISTAIWGDQGVTSFQALQMPFLITDYGLEQKVIGGSVGQQMLRGVDRLGLVGLAIHEGGLRKPLGAKKPLVSPADFRASRRRPTSGPCSRRPSPCTSASRATPRPRATSARSSGSRRSRARPPRRPRCRPAA